jgi:Helix-turn-helix
MSGRFDSLIQLQLSTKDRFTLGRAIAPARKLKGLSQKELATTVIKGNGEAITPQYLNDIEHDRRTPSSEHLVGQFARVPGIDSKALFAIIGILPEHERNYVRSSELRTSVTTNESDCPSALW